jgi:hypothetical protein
MPAKPEPPFHPIVYVRGYAGSQSEVEETVATPYMGFNLGATKARQRWDGAIVRHVFESPLVRLIKDHGYRDVYSHGSEILEDPLPPRSVVIYRYYEPVSKDLGEGVRPEIEDYARGLDELIGRLRKQVCAHTGQEPESFRVYLVAHSMGGLICRAFLQNPKLGADANRKAVDKVFTYATPHGGIDVRVLGNLPSFFTRNNADNFNRDRMRGFLALKKDADVRSLDGKFDPRRFFCLVGTNARDYEAAGGLSRVAVGPISDGLVRIENASVNGAPRAFVHKSHSGQYGVVNSEEGYQNLTRFLFGDVRIDGVLEVEALDLPPDVQKAYDKQKTVRASYHFEVVVRPRGGTWVLHSRTAAESSAIFRTFDEMLRPKPGADARQPHLFSTFLSARRRTKRGKGPLVFALDLSVRVPDYEIDGLLFFDSHIEGSRLYDRTIVIGAVPPEDEKGTWSVRYGFNPLATNPTPREAEETGEGGEVAGAAAADGAVVFRIPIARTQKPGMQATLVLTARAWS